MKNTEKREITKKEEKITKKKKNDGKIKKKKEELLHNVRQLAREYRCKR